MNNLTVLLLRSFSTFSTSFSFKPKTSSSSVTNRLVLSQIITKFHGRPRLATLTRRYLAHHGQIKGAGLVPVRTRSILSTTRSASSGVKHMGGLNLRTLR